MPAKKPRRKKGKPNKYGITYEMDAKERAARRKAYRARKKK